MVKDYSRPRLCRKPPSTILRTASCNIVMGCSQHHCVPACSTAFPSRLTKKPMPSNSCNSFETAMIKFPSDFSLSSLSVFDFKWNYWVNLAQSAIPEELESKIHVISATKNSVKHPKHSPEHLSNMQMQRIIWSLSVVVITEALVNPRRVLIR